MQLFIIATIAQFALGTPINAKGASRSPGFASGNIIQVPANIPINASGNSVNVIGAVNPVFGNTSTNESKNL
jgi:hypothetical protein